MNDRGQAPVQVAELNDTELRQKLNLETGRLAWVELQRHYARGAVLAVAPGLDLIEVALALARDDRGRIESWTDTGRLDHASDDQARRWHRDQSEFWALVVMPWVLVQPIEAGTTPASE